jgi:glycerol-3-phosphate dehydrogenase
VPGLAYLRAEAVFAVRHEMATTLDDVLTRRTRAHLRDRAATLAPPTTSPPARPRARLGRRPRVARQVDAYRELCAARNALSNMEAPA